MSRPWNCEAISESSYTPELVLAELWDQREEIDQLAVVVKLKSGHTETRLHRINMGDLVWLHFVFSESVRETYNG